MPNAECQKYKMCMHAASLHTCSSKVCSSNVEYECRQVLGWGRAGENTLNRLKLKVTFYIFDLLISLSCKLNPLIGGIHEPRCLYITSRNARADSTANKKFIDCRTPLKFEVFDIVGQSLEIWSLVTHTAAELQTGVRSYQNIELPRSLDKQD